MSIIDKLNYLIDAKNAIKKSIIDKGVDVGDSDTLKEYADRIGEIETVNDTNTAGYIGVARVMTTKGFPIITEAFTSGDAVVVSSKDFHPGDKDWEIHIRFKYVGGTSRVKYIFGGYTNRYHAPLIQITGIVNRLTVSFSPDGMSESSRGNMSLNSVHPDVWSEVTLEHIKEEGIMKLSLIDETIDEPLVTTISDVDIFDQSNEGIVSFGVVAKSPANYFIYKDGSCIDFSQTWIKIDGKYFLKV